MEQMLMQVLLNLVRTGIVSSVDTENRTARVVYNDKKDADGQPLVSGQLKVIQNQPLITIEKWVEEGETENKWGYEAHYASADRNLGLGESYTKGVPDIIKNEKIIKYEKKEPIPEPVPTCFITGVIESKLHRQTVTVYPWLPFIGQYVLCLYLPNGESDGFVLGGI